MKPWVLLFAVAMGADRAEGASPTPPQVFQNMEEVQANQAVIERIDAAIVAGTADPVADAAAAVARGEFGLITSGDGARGGYHTPGVICFTPWRRAPAVTAHFSHGDVIEPYVVRLGTYASDYNLALVAHPDYRDADLCRASSDADAALPWRPRLDLPARAVVAPVRSLHEAARRGTAAEVAQWVRTTPVDSPDGFGLSPLAWAVARDNRAAVEALLAARANPWASARQGSDAVYWAATYGRADWFERFVAMPGHPDGPWTGQYLAAAANGGNGAIVGRMLAEPHHNLDGHRLDRPLPAAEVLELFLAEDLALANQVLARALEYRGVRVDLIRLALEHGADPNAKGPEYDTVLATAAGNAWWPERFEIVDLLLDAGADANRLSHWDRPIWAALRIIDTEKPGSTHWAPTLAVVDRLRAAGADLNLPDRHGRPGVWRLLFPGSGRPDDLAESVSPELIEALVRRGLDLNVKWEGRRLLPHVEKVAERDSPMAATLRRLGARR